MVRREELIVYRDKGGREIQAIGRFKRYDNGFGRYWILNGKNIPEGRVIIKPN